MNVYKITNAVNGKVYIGITNNPKRRWSNHQSSTKSLIGKAIHKYGVENFKFEILYSGLSIEEAEEKEISLIAQEKSLWNENGYNIALGGHYNIWQGQNVGENNPNHTLTEEDVKNIKDHRNVPLYVLFEDYSEIISYEQFQKIYRDEVWKEVTPTVEQYPYNLEFSCQFNNSTLDYSDIVKMRELYSQGIPPTEAYKEFKDKTNFFNFGNAYRGDTFKLVMPEVFSKENIHQVLSNAHSGEKNGRAKLTKSDVIEIRRLYEQEGLEDYELLEKYPQVSITSIRNVINYKTWKNI